MRIKIFIVLFVLFASYSFSQVPEKSAFLGISPNLIVEDVKAAHDFYVEKLGFKSEMFMPDTGKMIFAMLKRDSVTVMFQSVESMKQGFPLYDIKPASGSVILYIKITDFDELVYELKENRVQIERYIPETFYGTREMVIRDNSGHFIVFAMDLVKQ